MYEILMDGEHLYYPGDEILALSNAVLNTQIGDSGFINLTVPNNNPRWGDALERESIITVLKDKVEIFSGEVRETGKNLSLERTIYAVGELAWLSDSIQGQAEYHKSISECLAEILQKHNAQVEERKQFQLGYVTIDDDVVYFKTNYDETLKVLRDHLCRENGYLRLRKVDGVKYIDIVKIEDYGNRCAQPIQFGRNLLDYTDSITSDSVTTVLIPLGAKLGNSSIEGIDEYLTIKSVNDGKDYLVNEDAVSAFGVIKRAVKWDDVTIAEHLKTKGEEWLAQNQYKDLSISVKTIDLSVIDSNTETFNLGDSVRVIAKPFGLDAWYSITDKVTDLLNLENNTITIGKSVKLNYTKSQIQFQNGVDKIPTEEEFLEIAKNEASSLLKNATEGNIYYIYDENGKAKELLIMDTNDISTAQKVWRWNINGLGYSNTGYDGTFGLAMTMNGEIVADKITTGTLRGITLDGNIIKSESATSKATIQDGHINTYGNSRAESAISCISNSYNQNASITPFDFSIKNSSTDYAYFNAFSFTYNGERTSGMYVGDGNGHSASVYDDGIDVYYGSSSSTIRPTGITTTGSLTVKGSKSRAAETDTFGDRLLYCLETPTPMFSDLGSGELDESGECEIWIDDTFYETVDTECEYQVFLQKYGEGDCWVAERNNGSFIVKGTPGLQFGWEVKAVQLGFDSLRLDTYEREEENPDDLYETSYVESLELNEEEEEENFDYLFDLIDDLNEEDENND